MGCKLGSLAAAEFVHDPFHRPPPPADPRSPLTAKQQYCMLASWKGIARAFEKTGIVLFVKLFEENEELLHLFENFSQVHTLATSQELAEHATKVMHTLDEGIKNLANMDAFLAYIRHVGATHRNIEGFKAENFWKIEQPFLNAAQVTLGERYTENIANIFTITIRFLLENLVKGFDDHRIE